MEISKVTDCVGKDRVVLFSFFRSGELWYRCENGFEFPIPIDDTGTGTFLASDKSIYFMRWIRKHIDACRQQLDLENTKPMRSKRDVQKAVWETFFDVGPELHSSVLASIKPPLNSEVVRAARHMVGGLPTGTEARVSRVATLLKRLQDADQKQVDAKSSQRKSASRNG